MVNTVTPVIAKGIYQLAELLRDAVDTRTQKLAYPEEWQDVTMEDIEADILIAKENLKNYLYDNT